MAGTVNLGRRKQIGDYVSQVVRSLRQYTQEKEIRNPTDEQYLACCTHQEFEVLKTFRALGNLRPKIQPHLSEENFNKLAFDWEKRVLTLEDVPAIEALVGECQAKLMEIQRTAPPEYLHR